MCVIHRGFASTAWLRPRPSLSDARIAPRSDHLGLPWRWQALSGSFSTDCLSTDRRLQAPGFSRLSTSTDFLSTDRMLHSALRPLQTASTNCLEAPFCPPLYRAGETRFDLCTLTSDPRGVDVVEITDAHDLTLDL